MEEEAEVQGEDFFITYKDNQVKVSSVINKGNIYFIVHFKTPVIIAEGMAGDEWIWFEADKGETSLAAELGEIIEKMDI